MNITFARPEYFYLLLVLLPLIGWYIWKQKRSSASMRISTISPFRNSPKTWKHYLRHLLFVMQLGVMSLLIAALAKPQSSSSWRNQTIEGIDIIIALD
ncbi:MAG: BatA domain-containing protein, partial [Bacteroidia bacterium]|nr:BatA domain-containing protein [Bacteroidia bacterium]